MKPGGYLVNISRYCLICILLLMVQGVSALSVSVAPEQIEKGDQVTISIYGLADNSTFSMEIEGTFSATPGGSFSFETRDLNLPFTLNGGSLSATMRNTETNVLIIRKGDTEVKKVGLSQDGVFSTTDSGSIPAGKYDLISLGGTAAQAATAITASVALQGSKSGPVDSEITFFVDGVSDGKVTVTITVDGGSALVRTIQIGNPVTVTATPTYYQGGGGGGSSGGPVSSTTAATTVSTTAVTTSPTTVPTTYEDVTSAAQGTVQETALPQEQDLPPSPAPIGAPLPPFLVLIGIAMVGLACAWKRP